jgi:predicted RNA-binding protein YlqC (UPF0109 family)
MEAPIARLQHHVETNGREVIDDDHDRHVSIVHGKGHIIVEIYCEKREAGMLIGGNRHGIEAIRSLPQAPSCAARLRPSIDLVTAYRRDR